VRILIFVPLAVLLAVSRALFAQPLPMTSAESQGFSQERLERVSSLLKQSVAKGEHSGFIVLVARRGKIVEWNAYGFRDIEAKLPMEKDTIVRIYSMTKVVTSVAAMILHEEGRLKLSDGIGRYYPELAKMKVWDGGTASAPVLVDARREIAIEDLLTHTSGFIYGFGQNEVDKLYQEADTMNSTSMEDFIARAAKLPLAHQPGERFSYGIGIDIVGAVVETVSGMPLERFVEERITKPLGMVDTGFDVPEAKRARMAKVYALGKDGKTLVDQGGPAGVHPEPGKGFAAGGAGMFSTASDYARFGQMLLDGGELDGVRIISRKTVELMTVNHLAHLTPPTTAFSASSGFGIGGSVRISLAPGALGSVGEFGWTGAATTYFDVDPKEDLLVLLLGQHMPFNQHDIFWRFSNLVYAALN
jgi:CubicO group peptidase (beta-lactamase class C family)